MVGDADMRIGRLLRTHMVDITYICGVYHGDEWVIAGLWEHIDKPVPDRDAHLIMDNSWK